MLQIVLVCELVLVESEHLVTGGVAEEGVAEEGVGGGGGGGGGGGQQASRAGVPITPTFDIEC